MEKQKLIVIGAGPKAMAIASKNCVLAELGLSVPEVHIIERHGVGANWTGDSGYTNGRLALGTAPEKDVGFPYQSDCWGDSLNPRVDRQMKDFSWQSFLIDNQSYSEWVDRGRPAPQHREWAAYLQWVWKRSSDRTICHRGEVCKVSVENNRWNVTYRTLENHEETIAADGLVMTGPGKMRLARPLPVHDRVLTVETFWRIYEKFGNGQRAHIALVGTGESAAAIAMALTQNGNDRVRVDIISPNGMAFSRGESYQENQVYSSAERGHWNSLTENDRRNFIRRTDRGVFSVHAQTVLNQARCLRVIPGRLATVSTDGDKIQVNLEYAGNTATENYDYVIVATGADQLTFLKNLMGEFTESELLQKTGLKGFTQEAVENHIDRSLSIEGLKPRLHLPMLSGMNQGPGFANLSCLGRLSDRILEPYLARCL